jgi:protocatechuate 3,4-dioxygenase alpha subunit
MPSATSSQTIGPYWHLLEEKRGADLTRFGVAGEKIRLIGTITDGDGAPVSDACVELWQVDPPGADDFVGFGRCGSDAEGNFRFVTVKPGPVPGRGNQQQAPHFAITLLARGLLKGLVTRAYFEGETLNGIDPLLSSIENPRRRDTLIAKRVDATTWRLDIRLQGEDETVFLAV